MLCKKSLFLAISLSIAGSVLFHEAQAQNKDTVWVPVIFYDYWIDANGTNPDFEIAPVSAQGFPGMVQDTMDSQRKPVPTPAACPTPSTAAPAACHLAEWFRVSGATGSDQTCIFTCDSLTNRDMKRWNWTTSSGGPLTPYLSRPGEFVGPHYDSTYPMRNIIIYDSIPFVHLGRDNPALLGIYEINNPAFFPLDNRGFGIQPAGQSHNFGMAMELHTTFSYKTGLNFTFAGDDDCWVFINGKKVVDLGGRHGALTSSVNLDTMAGLEVGKIYNLDFFYAERHTTGSDIRITSNMIAPTKIGIQVVPSTTIRSGDSVTITGTLLDGAGNPMPGNLSDSITWTIDPATKNTGDTLLIKKGKTTKFTGTTSTSRTVTIIGTYGNTNKIVGQVQITILPGIPKYIVIYNADLAPPTPGTKLPDPSQFTTIVAGTRYLLAGNAFDKYDRWLSEYRIAPDQSKISWEARDRAGSLNSKLEGLTGAVIYFKPTQAYDTVTIITTLRPDAITAIMDTVRFVIVPGPEKYLVIEPKGNLNKIHDNPLDTLFIMEGENSNPVYTTVRDTFGNFVRYGSISAWSSLNNTIVTVASGDITFGEGIVTRNLTATDSITKITAVDTNKLLKPDTSNVKLAKFYYKNLRIVIGSNTNPANLTMNTNQDTTLTVQGMRSNDSVWVDVSANWKNSTNLKIDPTAPTGHSWRFSPTDTGTGTIVVFMNNEKTIPDTLPVYFTPGPPVRATIEILTPAAEIIAGKPITAVVRVFDKDGNSYTYKFDTTASGRAAYHDLLGTGGASFPEPVIIIDGKTIRLYPTPWESGNETFINGRDTVSITLYNAPLDTTLVHQISTNLIIGTDTIRASSTPFVLHPDKLSQVRIEYPNGTPVTDTLILSANTRFVSRGYDQYGNPYGEIIGNWITTDSLHPIAVQTNGSSITYDPAAAIKNERGYIIVDHNGIKDSIYVIITGPLIKLESAITRDVSGNGILDQIELHFSREFTLPANASFAGLTIVANQSDALTVGRILNTGTGRDTNVWIVELVESHVSQPQTAWTPRVTLPQQNDYELAAVTVTAVDGAGPVVWRVELFPVVAGNPALDTVVITFSEPVLRNDGGELNMGDKPSEMFYVWMKDQGDTTKFIMAPQMFADINNLKRDPGKSNSITFTMSNGQELTRAYFVSIDSVRKYVTDATVNAVKPNSNNNPKQVMVNTLPGVLHLLNPIGPTFNRKGPGVFELVNNINAKKWVTDDHGRGAVIEFNFAAIPTDIVETDKTAAIKLSVRIYDVIGNVVQSKTNADFLSSFDPEEVKNQASVKAQLYWNGSNDKGMAVAPGVYRVVVYLQYMNINSANRGKPQYRDQRMIGKQGISR